MATSQYTYSPYHTIGAASLLTWDPSAGSGSGAWRPLGKVADAAVVMATEQAGKDLTIKGLTQPIARRNRAKRYSITFRMLEDANPLAHDLLYSEGAAQASAAAELVAVSEVVRLFGGEYRELSHPYGIAQTPPGGVSNPHAEAGGSGGTIPPGTYYYWIVPVVNQGGPLEFEGQAVSAGSVIVGAGEVVTFTFTPPDDYSPAHYRVYYNTSDTLTGASLAADELAGSPAVVSSHIDSTLYNPLAQPLVAVFSYDGLTQYTLGTDFLVDVEKGLVKRVSGGGIDEGASVLVVYAYSRPAGVITPLGDSVDLERYRRIKLLQLAADDPDPALWHETGIEFEFYKVNVSLNDASFPFSEDEFTEGVSVTWDCLYDGARAKVGDVRSTYGVLAQYS